MVTPVYGPFNDDVDLYTYYRVARRYKQRAPYTVNSPYTMYTSQRTYCVGDTYNPGRAASYALTATYVNGLTETNQAKILAYERLKAAISDRASMGENLVDVDKSVRTIVNRSRQLFEFTKAVKKGHFGQAAAILRTPEPRTRHPIREQANNWLEYHLGIEPLVRDIYNAMDLIQRPVEKKLVKARASIPVKGGANMLPTQASWKIGYRVRVHYQTEVVVTNPALWLANSLGILNPVQVLWQTVPLSFVLDWFSNVEQFLGTPTDFWGLSTQNSLTTVSWSGTRDEWYSGYGWRASWTFAGMTRALGLTLPSLGLRPWKPLSWQRGLTAVALLTGALNSLDTHNYRANRRKLVFLDFDRNIQGRLKAPHRWENELRF